MWVIWWKKSLADVDSTVLRHVPGSGEGNACTMFQGLCK